LKAISKIYYFFAYLSISKEFIMKQFILILLAIFCVVIDAHAQAPVLSGTMRTGIGLGTIIAIVLSWSRNKSILWLLLHGFFGWFYVIYFVLTR
jgi:hypothetical protein